MKHTKTHQSGSNRRQPTPLYTLLLAAVAAAAAAGGCGPKAYVNESFDPQRVDRVVVLPVMDNRRKADPNHDFTVMASDASNVVVKSLKFQKGYRAVTSADIGGVST